MGQSVTFALVQYSILFGNTDEDQKRNSHNLMKKARYAYLMRNQEAKLTPDEMLEGWHFCAEWDGLLLDPDDVVEWGDNPNKCRCGIERPTISKPAVI